MSNFFETPIEFLKGIGPTYMDKTGRNGLRVGDIFSPNFQEKYDILVEKHVGMLKHYEGFEYDLSSLEKPWMEAIESLKKLQAVDSEHYLNTALLNGKRVLAEGAQGTMLVIDFGTYPFVTSSNTVTAGTCTGLGIAPTRIGKVIGIFKAYCTRVGSGPFPTELLEEDGETIRKEGNEFGSTTGRPRRCGWIDLVALKYTCMINGVTQIIMTKADILDSFKELELGILHWVKIEDITIKRTLSIVINPNRYRSKASQAFSKEILTLFVSQK